MADRELTGILLVGGASRRFGSPKALARLDGETLAERLWRVLGEACDERVAVGKTADALALPFPILDDGSARRHPAAGIVAGLRAAAHEVAVVVPVDAPLVTPAALRALAEACLAPRPRDVAVADGRPLPGAYRRTALPALERVLLEERSLRSALEELDVVRVALDPGLLANANTPEELAAIESQAPSARSRSAR